jgi:hypothetical protein
MSITSGSLGESDLDASLPARLVEEKLLRLLEALIDQRKARVLVAPQAASTGYWFGGGNIVRDRTGTLWIVGRYRNYGDSRTGLGAGERGLELALFASDDGGRSFSKLRAWSKQDLSYAAGRVVSIEGSALHARAGGGWELFVSSEKDRPYPEGLEAYRKAGTGVWSIDLMHGDSPDTIDVATLRPALDEAPEPGYLHVKDPKVFDAADGSTVMLFCDHPFTWSSANSGYAVREPGAERFTVQSWELIARGPVWDVAGTRLTSRMVVPAVGVFAQGPPVAVYFYDGLECYRPHEQNPGGVARPRGYSCEELGGACYGLADDFPRMTRLSRTFPLFVSPHGTGCSRYVDALVTEDGIRAIWQQSQPDESQPLVGHFLPMDEVVRLLN